MRAIRKRASAPGLELDEVPVPTPGPDEVLVRIEAASICGTDLHIARWDQWSSERVTPPLTLGHELCGTVVAVGSAVRDVERGRLRLGGEPRHVRRLLPLPNREGAHVRADADPRRRSRRRLRRLRRHAGLGRVAQRSLEAAARDRVPAGAVRERRLRDVDAGSRRTSGRRPRLRARSASSRSRSRRRSARGGCFASDHVPFRMELARALGADDGRERRRGRGRPRVVRRAERRSGRRRRVRDVRRAARRSRTRSASSGTAATSSSSGFRPGRRRSTSPSR